MNMNGMGGGEGNMEDAAPAAARKRIEVRYMGPALQVNDLSDLFEVGKHLRVWHQGSHAFEGVIAQESVDGILKFEYGKDPDENPLYDRPIVEIGQIDLPEYQRILSESGEADSSVRYGGSTLYAARDASGNLFLIERLPEGKVIVEREDEFRANGAQQPKAKAGDERAA